MNLRWIFIGSGGLRAGWSIAIFSAIVTVEVFGINFLLKALHAPRPTGHGEIPPLATLAIEAVFILTIALATFVMSRIEARPFLAYGYSGPRKLSRFLWGLLSGFVALSALVGVLALAHLIVIEKTTLSGSSIFGNGLIWLAGFVMVGIAEESWTRGYLLFTLTRGLNFFWASVILSIAFGAIHAQNPGESPLGLVGAAAIGLVFCYSVWLTGSLYWAIGIHAAWDWAQSYLVGVADSGLRMRGHFLESHSSGNIWLSGGATGPEGSVFCLLTVLLIALGLYLVWGRKPALRAKGSLFAQS